MLNELLKNVIVFLRDKLHALSVTWGLLFVGLILRFSTNYLLLCCTYMWVRTLPSCQSKCSYHFHNKLMPYLPSKSVSEQDLVQWWHKCSVTEISFFKFLPPFFVSTLLFQSALSAAPFHPLSAFYHRFFSTLSLTHFPSMSAPCIICALVFLMKLTTAIAWVLLALSLLPIWYYPFFADSLNPLNVCYSHWKKFIYGFLSLLRFHFHPIILPSLLVISTTSVPPKWLILFLRKLWISFQYQNWLQRSLFKGLVPWCNLLSNEDMKEKLHPL